MFVSILIAVGIIALIAGFIHSAIGFGFGIVAVTLMPLVMDVKQAHVVISIASVPVLMMAAWAYREGADFKTLRQALLGALICLPLGLLAFEFVSADWLIRGTGLAILAMVAMSYRNRKLAKTQSESEKPSERREGSAFGAGALGGFLAGAVSIAGPPIAAYGLQQQWEQGRFKAFLNQFLLIVSTLKAIGLASRGFVDSSSLVLMACLAPMAILGIQLGKLCSSRFSTNVFQGLVAAALIAISVYFMVRGAG